MEPTATPDEKPPESTPVPEVSPGPTPDESGEPSSARSAGSHVSGGDASIKSGTTSVTRASEEEDGKESKDDEKGEDEEGKEEEKEVDPNTIVGTAGDDDPMGGPEAKMDMPTLEVLQSMDEYIPNPDPTVFDDDIKQPRGKAAHNPIAATLGSNIGSISPRSRVEATQTEEERQEVLEKDKYLKKHPELLDFAQHMYLQVLKHKPEADPNADPDTTVNPIINYFALTFFGDDNLIELEKIRKASRERYKYG